MDQAYTANEVGYGDLASLDEEFKEREARLKEEEEDKGWRMFGEKVVGPVTKRLKEEVGKLEGERKRLVEQALVEATAGREWWFGPSNGGEKKPGVGEVLRIILDIHTALELRAQKLTDIQLEKTRREKKMVCARMYERGEIKRMKETEKGFEKAEKVLLHNSAIEWRDRAVELQRVVEEGVMGGLEEELAYSEVVTNAVKALLEEIPPSEESMRERSARDPEWAMQTEAALGKSELLLGETSTRTVRLFEVFYDAGMELARAEFEEKLSGGRASGAAVTKEEMDNWEKLRKGEEGRLRKELDERKGLVMEEWEGVKASIQGAAEKVRKVIVKKEVVGGKRAEEMAEEVQVQQAPQSQGKGVWGWFK